MEVGGWLGGGSSNLMTNIFSTTEWGALDVPEYVDDVVELVLGLSCSGRK